MSIRAFYWFRPPQYLYFEWFVVGMLWRDFLLSPNNLSTHTPMFYMYMADVAVLLRQTSIKYKQDPIKKPMKWGPFWYFGMKCECVFVCLYVCHSITWVKILWSFFFFVRKWTCFLNRHILVMSRIWQKNIEMGGGGCAFSLCFIS